MTPDQNIELQSTVERIAFEIQDMRARLLYLELNDKIEDTRKRIFRTAVIAGIAAMLAMQWWGFSQILAALGWR